MLASNPIGASIAAGLNKIHDSWGWFIALGIALILLDSDTGYGTRIRLAAHHGRRRRADPGVSGAQLERVLSSLPERTAARVHRIYAGALPAGGGIRSDHAARLALHRWRRVPGLWRRRTEVPTVGQIGRAHV